MHIVLAPAARIVTGQLTPVARVGTTVTVALTRIATGVNAATVSGYLVGVSADT